MFGGDTNKFIAAHPATIAKQNADALRGKIGIKIVIGSLDGHVTNNRAMHQALTDLKLDHEFSEVPESGHDIRRLSMWLGSDGLEFAVKHFASARDTSNDGPWVNPPHEKEKTAGTEHHIYWSELLNRPVGYNIYLPPDYYDALGHGLDRSTNRFPVVYYLHGMTDSESTHLYNGARLDDAIRAGRVPPMICVWTYEGRRSCFTDYADGSVRAESMFINELIPNIDARWRTIADRGHRALHGWSMGGNGALRIGLKHSDLFSSVVTFGGGFSDYAHYKERLPDLAPKIFGDQKRFDADSAWTLVRGKTEVLKTLPLRQVVGEKDFLLEPNRKMHALLNALGVQHEYAEIPDTGHDPKKVWDAQGEAAYAFSANHFPKP
jgi:enterochelin esterase-like enzyme